MELIVHIGQGKTGSSSIQGTLLINKKKLRELDVVYTGLNFEHSPIKQFKWQKPGNWHLILHDEIAQRELLSVMKDTVISARKSGVAKLIWSNESLFTAPQVVKPILKEIQKMGVKIRIIVYMRRHDSWARSAYMQWGIKHKTYTGALLPFGEWIKANGLHFSTSLTSWVSEDWDNINVINFDDVDKLIESFFLCCDIDIARFKEFRGNDTPSNVPANLWALYNAQKDTQVLPHDLMGMFGKAGVINKRYKHVELNELFPTQAQLRAVYSSSSPDIEKVNSIIESFGGVPFSKNELASKDYTVSTEQMISCLLDVVKSQNDRLEELERKFEQLNNKLK
ncbi:MAG: hypothetical protein ACPG46_01720 [Thalassotalea sp.]